MKYENSQQEVLGLVLEDKVEEEQEERLGDLSRKVPEVGKTRAQGGRLRW